MEKRNTTKKSSGQRVAVVGGGAAGMMAAIAAAQAGAQVVLLEKNEKLGKKIFITGKGRCNVTNACPTEEFLEHVVHNPRFLYSALYGFTNDALMQLLEAEGCALKTERGERVFPVSDRAYDVTDALKRLLKRLGVQVLLNAEVTRLLTDDKPCQDGEEGRREGSKAGDQRQAESIGEGRSQWGTEGSAEKGRNQRQEKNVDEGRDRPEKNAKRVTGLEYRICEKQRGKMQGGSLGSGVTEVKAAQRNAHGGQMTYGSKRLYCDRVIIATGGKSYPTTGSTGDGYRFATEAGLRVTPLYPALVPLETEGEDAARLQGLSLKNVEVRVTDERGKVLASDFGELLFTHFGLSGPVVLSASSLITGRLNAEKSRGALEFHINLKPALSEKQLDERLLRDFSQEKNRQLRNAFGALFPAKLIPVFLRRLQASGIDTGKQVNELKRDERRKIVALTQDFSFTLRGTRRFDEAIITQGGVDVRDLNPATMEAKKVSGLYFAGEVVDIDAFTGGFNLQLAFSTGHLAGVSAGAGAGTEK